MKKLLTVETFAMFVLGMLLTNAIHDVVRVINPIEPEIIEVEKVIVKEVEVPVEVVKEIEVEVPIYVPYEKPFYRNFTEDDEWYYKDLAMREAEGEGVTGMLLVMYTAECRCEAFGHNISVEWGSSAYTSMNRSGKIPNEDCNRAFEIFREGWTPKPLYFRAGTYHNFATPLFQYGNHYFSM